MVTDIDPRIRQGRMAAYVGFAVQGLCFAALVTRIPQLQKAHGLGNGTLAVLLLAVPVIAGVGSVLAGLLMPRWGSGVVLRVCQPLVAAAIVAVGAAPDDVVLFIAVAITGLFLGAVDASMNQQAVTAEKHYGMSLLTGYYAAWSTAGILGGLWISLANKTHISLTVGFLVPAGIGAAASLLSGHLLFRRDLEAKIPSGDRLKAAATSVPWRPILVVGVAMMCMYIADSTISSYGAKFLQNDLHATASVAPIGYVAYQIAMVISRTGGDRLVRRHGAVRVVAVGSVIGGLGLVAAAASVDPVLSISGFGVAGLGLSVVIPASFSAAGSVDPTGLGIAVSRVNVFNYLGYVFGAVIGGIFASDLWVAYAVAAVLTLVVLGLARGFRPHPVTEPVAAPA